MNHGAFVTSWCKGSEGKDQSSIRGLLIPTRTHICILAFYEHVQKRDTVVSQHFDSKFQIVISVLTISKMLSIESLFKDLKLSST